MTDTKIMLPESEIPTHFYNIVPDLPTPLQPPLHPGTREPIGPEMLTPIFPMGLIAQEVSQDPNIEIPDEVDLVRGHLTDELVHVLDAVLAGHQFLVRGPARHTLPHAVQ